MPPYILRGKAYPRSLCALGSFNGEFVSVPRHELPNHQTPPSCCSGWSPCLARRRAGLGIFTRTTAALGFSHRVFTLHDLGWTRPGPSLDGSSALMSALFAVQWRWSLTPNIPRAHRLSFRLQHLTWTVCQERGASALCVLSWEETPHDLGSPL